MKKIFLYFLLSFYTLYGSNYNCERSILDNKFQSLGNCSWINDATAFSVNTMVNYNGKLYFSKRPRESKHTKYFNQLYLEIEKSIVSNLYFTNWKFIDYVTKKSLSEVSEGIRHNRENFYKLQKENALRIVDIYISIDLYRYNKQTNLHYGLLNIIIDPHHYDPSMKWYSDDKVNFTSNLYNGEYRISIPFAGYKNNEKILIKNITNEIQYYFNTTFKKYYNDIKSKLLSSDSILLEYDEYKVYNDRFFLEGVDYLLSNNKNIDLKINKEYYENEPDTFLFNKKDSEKVIKEKISKYFDDGFEFLYIMKHKNKEKIKEDYIEYYLKRIKQDIKTREF